MALLQSASECPSARQCRLKRVSLWPFACLGSAGISPRKIHARQGFAMRERIGRIQKCRISQSTNLVSVLSLGSQALTGVFPRRADAPVTVGPLELVWCPDSGLLQLAHYYDASEMYGENYGYRSGLNQSMVRHLTQKIHQ